MPSLQYRNHNTLPIPPPLYTAASCQGRDGARVCDPSIPPRFELRGCGPCQREAGASGQQGRVGGEARGLGARGCERHEGAGSEASGIAGIDRPRSYAEAAPRRRVRAVCLRESRPTNQIRVTSGSDTETTESRAGAVDGRKLA